MFIAGSREIHPRGSELRHSIGTNWKIPLLIAFAGILLGLVYFLGTPSSLGKLQIATPSVLRARESTSNMVLSSANAVSLGDIGIFSQGEKIEIPLVGPDLMGLSEIGNPFKLQVQVTFTGPSGQSISVPAFYDGDGAGGQVGNIWKVRFNAGEPGMWSFTSSNAEGKLSAYQGVFNVSAPQGCESFPPGGLPNFACTGFLKYAGGHYLKFENGGYWIKGGIDDPENFLGNAIGDWDAKKAAIDYLNQVGVNSIYVITNNIDGGRKDTWPWVGSTPTEAKANSDTFDVAKLQAWEDFFSYVESKGIVLHIILNDDGAWREYDHQLYYQEMIARFGHHPGIIWNLGEEANEIYSDSEQISFAGFLKSLDPYDHPITVHRHSPWPFLGNPNFDLTSIQFGAGTNDFTTAKIGNLVAAVSLNREESAAAGRPLPVMIDETPRVTQVNSELQLKMRSNVLYPIFLSGGSYEMHFYDNYDQGGYLTIQDLGPMLEDMQLARKFVETLPFQSMQPCSEILSNPNLPCFGKSGEVYAIYLPEGGTVSVDLSVSSASFEVAWYDPRTGGTSAADTVGGGGTRSFTAPSNMDWVLHLSTDSPFPNNPCSVSGAEGITWGGVMNAAGSVFNSFNICHFLPVTFRSNH